MSECSFFRPRTKPLSSILGFIIFGLGSLNSAIANEDIAKKIAPIHYLLMDDSPELGALVEHDFQETKNTGPDKNPMKGWSDGWNRTSQNRTETSVGFQYIPWWKIEPVDDQYDKAAVENILDQHGTTGRHIIIRVHCDWAGEHEYSGGDNSNNGRSRGCPEWIYTDKGVAHIEGEEQTRVLDSGAVETYTRNITDVNDPVYIEESAELIAKLAEFYKDDPRLYAVELGFLGYWGEWHTFGVNLNPNPPAGSDYIADDVNSVNNYIIKDSSRQAILDASQFHFSTSLLMGRYPYIDFFQDVSDVGYHNDFFIPNDNLRFENAVADDERWKQGTIGGEAPPEFFKDNSTAADEVFTTPKGMEMIETGHYSTMLLNGTPEDSSHIEGYMDLHRKMGYNYQIDSALFPERLKQGEPFNITLSLDNIGVAPFYYDWTIQYALLNSNNQVVKTVEALNYDLREMMPDSMTDINGLIRTANVAEGEFKIGVRIIQPSSQDAKAEQWKLLARNTYIVFSNDIPVVDGVWNANNELVGGWSILGSVTLE